MQYTDMIEIANWLKSIGLELDLDDCFWMDDYRWSEHKVEDIIKYIFDYHKWKSDQKSIPNLDEKFRFFWQIYPRRDGKKAAFTSYCKQLKNGVTPEAIWNGANRYARHCLSTGQLIAHASTWLNGERWNDELKLPQVERKQSNHEEIFTRAMDQVDRMTAND